MRYAKMFAGIATAAVLVAGTAFAQRQQVRLGFRRRHGFHGGVELHQRGEQGIFHRGHWKNCAIRWMNQEWRLLTSPCKNMVANTRTTPEVSTMMMMVVM